MLGKVGTNWGNHEEKFITIIKLSTESRDLCYAAMLLLLNGVQFIIMNNKQKSAWSAPVSIEIEIDKKV